MASDFTPIAQLSNSTTEWKIMVKINRKYLAIKPGVPTSEATLDFVATDQAGSQIHIEIDPDLITAYRDTLQEGKIYIISHFEVTRTTSYEPVNRPIKIVFLDGTTVVELSGKAPYIPDQSFDFCDFEDIPHHEGNDVFLIDLIGILCAIRDGESTRTKYGDTSKTNILLRNLEYRTLNVTLWAKISDDFNALSLRGEQKTIVLILTSMTVKKLPGGYRAASTSATKIYVNLDHPVVTQYLESVQGEDKGPQSLPAEKYSGSNSESTLPDETVQIQSILAMPRADVKEQQFRIVVTITEFDLTHGWYYDGCPICSKSMREKLIQTGCQYCGAKNVYAKPRYKLETLVSDGSESCNAIFFTHTGEQLVGKPIDSLASGRRASNRRLPAEVLRLINTNWELQVGINKKILTMPKLIFNVNKVLRQTSMPSAITAQPIYETESKPLMPISAQLLPSTFHSPQQKNLAQNNEAIGIQIPAHVNRGKRQLIETEEEPHPKQPRHGTRLQAHRFTSAPRIEEIDTNAFNEAIEEVIRSFYPSAFTVQTPTLFDQDFSPPILFPQPYQIMPSAYRSRIRKTKLQQPTGTAAATTPESDSTTQNINQEDEDEDTTLWDDLKDIGYSDEEIAGALSRKRSNVVSDSEEDTI